MKRLAFYTGVFVFGFTRACLTGVLNIIHGPKFTDVFVSQWVLGSLTGLLVLPIAMKFFGRRWTRIVACSVGSALTWDGILLAVSTQNTLTVGYFLALLGFATLLGGMCGFLSGWIIFFVGENTLWVRPWLVEPTQIVPPTIQK